MSLTTKPALSRQRGIMIVAVCCLAVIAEGFEIQAPGITLKLLTDRFGLSSGDSAASGFFSERSLFLSLGTMGLAIGALFGGSASDRLGRRWVAISAVSAFGLFSALTTRAASAQELLIWRFLTGLGLGTALPTLIAIASEAVPLHRRSMAVGLLYGSLPLGSVVAALLGVPLVKAGNWQAIYVIGGAIALVAAAGLALLLPASETAMPASDAPQAADAQSDPRGSLRALFAQGRAAGTAAILLGYMATTMVSYILIGWLPTLMLAKGIPVADALYVQSALLGFGLIGSVLTGTLIDGGSRFSKTAMLFSLTAAMIIALALAPPVSRVIALFVGGIGFGLAALSVVYVAFAMTFYPPGLRGSGVGTLVATGRVGATVGPLIVGALLAAGASTVTVIAALLLPVGLSALAALIADAKTGWSKA